MVPWRRKDIIAPSPLFFIVTGGGTLRQEKIEKKKKLWQELISE
jgi:hypothetical protein